MQSFGIKGFNGGPFTALSPSQEGFPAFEFANGYTTIGDSNYRPVESNDMVEKYYDALTWMKGKHTITAGFDLDPYQSLRNRAPVSPHGQFYYQNLYTNFAMSDFMLGYPSLAGSSLRDAVNEHLGASDGGIILMRRMMRDSLAAVAQGKDPLCIIRDPASQNVDFRQQASLMDQRQAEGNYAGGFGRELTAAR